MHEVLDVFDFYDQHILLHTQCFYSKTVIVSGDVHLEHNLKWSES